MSGEAGESATIIPLGNISKWSIATGRCRTTAGTAPLLGLFYTGNPMEELKRRMLRGLAVLQSAGLSVWNGFYRWLNRHWFGLTLGLILGAWFF